jgi:hypothetical protein
MYNSSNDPQLAPDQVTCPVCSEDNWPGHVCYHCGFLDDGEHDFDQDDLVVVSDDEPVPSAPELMFFWPEDVWIDPWEAWGIEADERDEVAS